MKIFVYAGESHLSTTLGFYVFATNYRGFMIWLVTMACWGYDDKSMVIKEFVYNKKNLLGWALSFKQFICMSDPQLSWNLLKKLIQFCGLDSDSQIQ